MSKPITIYESRTLPAMGSIVAIVTGSAALVSDFGATSRWVFAAAMFGMAVIPVSAFVSLFIRPLP